MAARIVETETGRLAGYDASRDIHTITLETDDSILNFRISKYARRLVVPEIGTTVQVGIDKDEFVREIVDLNQQPALPAGDAAKVPERTRQRIAQANGQTATATKPRTNGQAKPNGRRNGQSIYHNDPLKGETEPIEDHKPPTAAAPPGKDRQIVRQNVLGHATNIAIAQAGPKTTDSLVTQIAERLEAWVFRAEQGAPLW